MIEMWEATRMITDWAGVCAGTTGNKLTLERMGTHRTATPPKYRERKFPTPHLQDCEQVLAWNMNGVPILATDETQYMRDMLHDTVTGYREGEKNA